MQRNRHAFKLSSKMNRVLLIEAKKDNLSFGVGGHADPDNGNRRIICSTWSGNLIIGYYCRL